MHLGESHAEMSTARYYLPELHQARVLPISYQKGFFKKVHASIHVKTMQLDHSPSMEIIGTQRTSKPALRQPTSYPKRAPLFQGSCWKKARGGTQNPRCSQDQGGDVFTETHSKKSEGSPGYSFYKSLAFLGAVQSRETVCFCQPSLFCWKDFLRRVLQCFHDNKYDVIYCQVPTIYPELKGNIHMMFKNAISVQITTILNVLIF